MTKHYQIQPFGHEDSSSEQIESAMQQRAAAAQPEIVTYLERAAVDVQVATAKAYPRDRQKAMQAIVAEAMMDSEAMVYTLRYRDRESGEAKVVKGPSIRLAEIIMQNWGNLRVWATVIESRPDYIRARGSAWDVQQNAWGNEEVIVPTLDRHGNPLPERLRIIYQQVAISKALRNAILRVIPRSVVNTVMQAIERQQAVTPKAIASIRDWLRRIGVPESVACRVVGAQSLDNLTPTQLSTLRGLYAAIRDGEMTVQEAFATDASDEEAGGIEQPAERPDQSATQTAAPSTTTESKHPKLKPDPKQQQPQSASPQKAGTTGPQPQGNVIVSSYSPDSPAETKVISAKTKIERTLKEQSAAESDGWGGVSNTAASSQAPAATTRETTDDISDLLS